MTSTISEGLVTSVDGSRRLVGSRCTVCATHAFPAQGGCPRCGALTETVVLPVQGSVWSWTVQRLAPKPPFAAAGEFEPFTVAYVDLGVVKVESRLAGRAPDGWHIGDSVHLVVAADGAGAPAYWFEPTDRVEAPS